MAGDVDLLRTIELIYDSVDGEQGWQPLLGSLSGMLDSSGAHLFLRDQRRGEFIEDCLYGGDESHQEAYQRLAHTDPSWPLSAANPGEIINDVDHFSDRFFESTPLYNEVMEAADARYRMTSVFPVGDEFVAGFAMIRSKSVGSFQAEYVRSMEFLLPHIIRAMRLQGKMRRLERETDDLVAALDRLPSAAIIVSETLQLTCMNRQAEALIEDAEVLRVRRQTLVPDRASEAAALREAAEAAVALADGAIEVPGPPPEVVSLSRAGKPPLEVLAVPLRPQHRLRRETEGQGRALLLIYDPTSRPTVDPEVAERLFGFTTTEAVVATRLAGGESIEEIAAHRRCSVSTVRTHVKRVLQKTDTNRQADLVRLILTSPAAVSI